MVGQRDIAGRVPLGQQADTGDLVTGLAVDELELELPPGLHNEIRYLSLAAKRVDRHYRQLRGVNRAGSGQGRIGDLDCLPAGRNNDLYRLLRVFLVYDNAVLARENRCGALHEREVIAVRGRYRTGNGNSPADLPVARGNGDGRDSSSRGGRRLTARIFDTLQLGYGRYRRLIGIDRLRERRTLIGEQRHLIENVAVAVGVVERELPETRGRAGLECGGQGQETAPVGAVDRIRERCVRGRLSDWLENLPAAAADGRALPQLGRRGRHGVSGHDRRLAAQVGLEQAEDERDVDVGRDHIVKDDDVRARRVGRVDHGNQRQLQLVGHADELVSGLEDVRLTRPAGHQVAGVGALEPDAEQSHVRLVAEHRIVTVGLERVVQRRQGTGRERRRGDTRDGDLLSRDQVDQGQHIGRGVQPRGRARKVAVVDRLEVRLDLGAGAVAVDQRRVLGVHEVGLPMRNVRGRVSGQGSHPETLHVIVEQRGADTSGAHRGTLTPELDELSVVGLSEVADLRDAAGKRRGGNEVAGARARAGKALHVESETHVR